MASSRETRLARIKASHDFLTVIEDAARNGQLHSADDVMTMCDEFRKQVGEGSDFDIAHTSALATFRLVMRRTRNEDTAPILAVMPLLEIAAFGDLIEDDSH